MGRTGTWLAAHQLPIEPDIVTVGKGIAAGYAPVAAMLCREHAYEAVDAGSKNFEHGHAWDGAPQSCAVGLAVADIYGSRLDPETFATIGDGTPIGYPRLDVDATPEDRDTPHHK